MPLLSSQPVRHMTAAKSLLISLLLVLPLTGAIAPRATPVHLRPDSGSKVIRLVKAGETLPETISGWTAVSLAGPHDVFVQNSHIGKDLDVKPGSPLHLGAKSDSPVLTQSTVDDKVEITGLRGRWTQLRLDQPVTGYIFAPGQSRMPQGAPPITTAPVQDVTVTTVDPGPTKPTIGKAVSRTAAERESLAALPRLFEGVLASTRNPLRPRRPYDFALETENGTRFAYLNLSRVLLNTQIEDYLNRSVVVYGIARPVPDTKDIVITVESFQLR